MHLRRCATAIVAAVAAACSGLPAAVGAPSRPGGLGPGDGGPVLVAVPAAGTFYPVPVSRILGAGDSGYAIAPGSRASAPALGRGSLPSSGVAALVVNLAATAGGAEARLSVVPTGAPTASAPLLAVPAGQSRSVLLTLPLASAAGLDVESTGGQASVTADVVGFYAADDTVVGSMGSSGGYQPVAASRVLGAGHSQPLAPGGRQVVSVDLGPAAAGHVTALLLRATVATATAPGSVTLATADPVPDTGGAPVPGTGGAPVPGAGGAPVPGAGGAPVPGAGGAPVPGTGGPPVPGAGGAPVPGAGGAPVPTSPAPASVMFAAGSPATNLALVPVQAAADGRVDVTVTNRSTGTTGVYVDLVGFYDDGRLGPTLRYRPLPQTRVVETAAGLGASPLQPGRPATATPPTAVAGDSTFGLVGVVTATTSQPADLSVGASDQPAESFPLAPGATSSVAVQPELDAAGGLDLQSRTTPAPVDLTLDVTGSFEAYPPVTNPAARSWVPAVPSWQITAATR